MLTAVDTLLSLNIPPKKYEKKVVACACGTLPVIRHTITMTEISFFMIWASLFLIPL
ncbi:MAG: hypothetical protein LBB06_01010 [Endomicrobium sp.]|nr:hypothetical protein [Endomicrobium sp.]